MTLNQSLPILRMLCMIKMFCTENSQIFERRMLKLKKKKIKNDYESL